MSTVAAIGADDSGKLVEDIGCIVIIGDTPEKGAEIGVAGELDVESATAVGTGAPCFGWIEGACSVPETIGFGDERIVVGDGVKTSIGFVVAGD